MPTRIPPSNRQPRFQPIDLLVVFVPFSLLLHYAFHTAPVWVFLTASVAIVPAADWVRRATEQIGGHLGPAIGGLLNVTFGNVPELILALFLLVAGQAAVVKAQITGSIIGNSLLGLGLAILVGGWAREKQTIQRDHAGRLSSLLLLSVIALLVPAFFDYTERGAYGAPVLERVEQHLSLGVSVVLILTYILNAFYTFVTHRSVFPADRRTQASWSIARSITVLAISTAITAWEAELVSGALISAANQLGVTTFFLGITVLAIVGNAAEYVSATYFARQDRMGLAFSITAGSSIQMTLLVAPVLVIISSCIGKPMTLVFRNPLELVAVGASAFAVSAVVRDGETTWLEGVLLLAVYLLLGLAFFYMAAPIA